MRLGLGVCGNVNVSNAETMQLATYLPIRINNCGRVFADVYTSHEKLVQSLFAMRTTPLVALADLHPIGLWVIKVWVGCAGGVIVPCTAQHLRSHFGGWSLRRALCLRQSMGT
jgi:hypothetical protein